MGFRGSPDGGHRSKLIPAPSERDGRMIGVVVQHEFPRNGIAVWVIHWMEDAY